MIENTAQYFGPNTHPDFELLHGFIGQTLSERPTQEKVAYFSAEDRRADASLLYVSGDETGTKLIEHITLASRRNYRKNYMPASLTRYELGDGEVPLERYDCFHSPIVQQLTFAGGDIGLVAEPLHGPDVPIVESLGMRWGHKRHEYNTQLLYGDSVQFNARTDAGFLYGMLKKAVVISPEQTDQTTAIVEKSWYFKTLRKEIEAVVKSGNATVTESTVLFGGIRARMLSRSSK